MRRRKEIIIYEERKYLLYKEYEFVIGERKRLEKK